MITNRKVALVALIVLAVSLSAVSASAFVFGALNTASQNTANRATNGYSNWMSSDQWNMGNMGNMMGGNWGPQPTSPTPTPVTTTSQVSVLPLIGFIALIGATLAGTGGAAFYFVNRPRISPIAPQLGAITPLASAVQEKVETPYDLVSKTLTVDERRVVDILTAHNGEYLQKYIRSETGLSRLKIHRIVTRLAERGIVTLVQSGNTNKVYLSSWLAKRPFVKTETHENAKQEMMIEA